MAKDPATLWYWNDWFGGTVGFTRHLKGCYMDLLYAQFNVGRLSLTQVKTLLGSDFGEAWPMLQEKFKKDGDGNYYNERAELEKEKRRKFTESRKKNLQNAHMEQHMGVHMENENGIENRNENSIQGIRKSEDSKGELPATTLELAEMNQYAHTGNRNTDFLKTQWQIFVKERENDPPAKKAQNKHRLGEYFLNWVRNKFPKQINGKKPAKDIRKIREEIEKGGHEKV